MPYFKNHLNIGILKIINIFQPSFGVLFVSYQMQFNYINSAKQWTENIICNHYPIIAVNIVWNNNKLLITFLDTTRTAEESGLIFQGITPNNLANQIFRTEY